MWRKSKSAEMRGRLSPRGPWLLLLFWDVTAGITSGPGTRPRGAGSEALGVSVRSAHAGSTRKTACPPRPGCGHWVGRWGRGNVPAGPPSFRFACSLRAGTVPTASSARTVWTGDDWRREQDIQDCVCRYSFRKNCSFDHSAIWQIFSKYSFKRIYPLQCSCLENPRDRGAWWEAVHGVAQSRARLKWLSSSSSKSI